VTSVRNRVDELEFSQVKNRFFKKGLGAFKGRKVENIMTQMPLLVLHLPEPNFFSVFTFAPHNRALLALINYTYQIPIFLARHLIYLALYSLNHLIGLNFSILCKL